MKKEKKPTSNILIVFVIFLLSLFIILPPVFRVVFADTTNKKSTTKKQSNSKLISLQCKYNKYNYSIKATTLYEDNEVTKVNLVYTNNAYEESGEPSADDLKEQENINKEIENYGNLIDAELSNEGFTTKIALTKKSLESNDDNENLSKLFDTLENVKKYYEDKEYECSEITN